MDGNDSAVRDGLGGRAAWTALLLVAAGVLIEAALVPPGVGLAEALGLVLVRATPYLVAAVSIAALGTLPAAAGASFGRTPLLAGATLLAVAAALTTPTPLGALARGELSVDGTCLRPVSGGPLAGCLPVSAVPLEAADTVLEVPAGDPATLAVRWVATRDLEPTAADVRVELVAGGSTRDLTAALSGLPAGGAAVLTRSVRVGPSPTTARLRVVGDPVPPTVFFDVARLASTEGLAVDAGGGDRAWREAPGPTEAPALRVRGEHLEGGHTAVVLSGEAWGSHDLGALRQAGGSLEMRFAGDDGWSVRLTRDGGETPPLALPAPTADDPVRIPLSAFAPSSPVVAVALVREKVGPFSLDLFDVRADGPATPRSGLGIVRLADGALTAATDARTPPVTLLRVGAAVLALLGGLGIRDLARLLRAAPGGAVLALSAGPALLVGLEALLPLAMAPRAEATPLVLTAVATAGALVTLVPRPQTEATPPVPARLAVLAFGALGVVAAHASADPTGNPWTEHPAADRVVPALVHGLAAAFDAPFFALVALYGLASSSAVPLREALRRWALPCLAWSLAWPLLGLAKAMAFGYDAAWRAHLGEPLTWARALIVGDAQYHLHLFPALFVLAALAPVLALSSRRPGLVLLLPLTVLAGALGAAALPTVFADPDLRTFPLALVRALSWVGYGWLVYALPGLSAPARRAALVLATLTGLAAATVLVHDAFLVAETGRWTGGIDLDLARGLLPAAVFTVAVVSDVSWPRPIQALGRYGFGIYLVHPLLLETVEIAGRGWTLAPAARVGLDILVVYAGSLVLAAVASRVPGLRALVAPEPR